jgi:hypothetical protein
MIVVANRVTSSTSSSSSSQIKQDQIKDENDNSRRNKNEDFFDDWKVGKWCWERDYNNYPVVVSLPAKNNTNNHNCHDGNGINDRSNYAKLNTTEHYEQCDEDRKLRGSNIDERKPAAITYSSIDSGRRSVTTTASATMEIATATKKDAREIPISKNPQVKVENNDEKKNTNDINDFSNNKYNENNNDDGDDDDSFYDDWVEGNWCLLDNSEGEGEKKRKRKMVRKKTTKIVTPALQEFSRQVAAVGLAATKFSTQKKNVTDDNSPRKMQHEVTTTPSLRNKSRNNNNDSARRKSKRFRYDDNDDSYNKDDVDEGEEIDDEDTNDDNKEKEEGFIPKDSKGVHNHHQEDKRPVKIRTQRKIHYDNHCNQLWMGMFQKLVEYKKQHTNTIVPQRYKNEPKLGFWVNTQRREYKNNQLSPHRSDILNSIGFKWDGIKCQAVTAQIKWMNMFQKLVAYKKQHRTTMVRVYYEEDPKLGNWVIEQRKVYRKDKLLPNRCALLKSIGFKWYGSKEHCQQLWMGMFQKLVAYNEQNKDTVPSHDSKLGRWVSRQRHYNNHGELLPKRIALLKSIDFF